MREDTHMVFLPKLTHRHNAAIANQVLVRPDRKIPHAEPDCVVDGVCYGSGDSG
jgi:hypothetical protein